jgi:ribosomal protein L37AE/L43A
MPKEGSYIMSWKSVYAHRIRAQFRCPTCKKVEYRDVAFPAHKLDGIPICEKCDSDLDFVELQTNQEPCDNWSDSSIQFPRLIAEIAAAVDFSGEHTDDLCRSMNLNCEDLNDLFERADNLWEAIKVIHGDIDRAALECPNCGETGLNVQGIDSKKL